MMRTLFAFIVLLVGATAFDVSAEFAPANAWPPIWPKPISFSNGNTSVVVDPTNLKLITSTPSKDLQGGFDRFVDRTFSTHVSSPTNLPPGTTTVHVIQVSVANSNVPLQLGVDETYKIEISTANGIVIHANTVYGAYHAFETVSQLIGFDFETQTFQVRYTPWIISDGPRLAHRALLMDTARHYLPIRQIKNYIDSLTYAKMNVLHWHIVDSQSFPYVGKSYPELGMKGSWSAAERFTDGDVAAVVEYARQRGVRVMIEVDTPGHSASMCRGRPDICPSPFCPGFSGNINNAALDITKNKTYDVVEAVISDLTKVAFDDMFHLGGDEVDFYCWQQHPAIMQWLKGRGMTVTDGFKMYLERIINYVSGTLKKTVAVWNDPWGLFGPSLPKDTVFQVWKTDNAAALIRNMTSHGYRVIANPSSVTYLDHLSVQWDALYQYEPCTDLGNLCRQVVGLTTSMWGETVDTSDGLQTIWPRAAAGAERAWSPASTTQSVSEALPRLLAFKCLLHQRGVPVAPVNNAEARQAPPNPGSCFWQ